MEDLGEGRFDMLVFLKITKSDDSMLWIAMNEVLFLNVCIPSTVSCKYCLK